MQCKLCAKSVPFYCVSASCKNDLEKVFGIYQNCLAYAKIIEITFSFSFSDSIFFTWIFMSCEFQSKAMS